MKDSNRKPDMDNCKGVAGRGSCYLPKKCEYLVRRECPLYDTIKPIKRDNSLCPYCSNSKECGFHHLAFSKSQGDCLHFKYVEVEP